MNFLSVCTKKFEDCEVGVHYRTYYWEEDAMPYCVFGNGMTKEVYDQHFGAETEDSIKHRKELKHLVENGIEQNVAIAEATFYNYGMQMFAFGEFVKVCQMRKHLENIKVIVGNKLATTKKILEHTTINDYGRGKYKSHCHFMSYAEHSHIAFNVWGTKPERLKQQMEYLEQINKLDIDVAPSVKFQWKFPLSCPRF